MIIADSIPWAQARVLGPPDPHQGTRTTQPQRPVALLLQSVLPISAPISWSCLLPTRIGCPCTEGRLEKRRLEGPTHRGHSKTIFFPSLDLRPLPGQFSFKAEIRDHIQTQPPTARGSKFLPRSPSSQASSQGRGWQGISGALYVSSNM